MINKAILNAKIKDIIYMCSPCTLKFSYLVALLVYQFFWKNGLGDSSEPMKLQEKNLPCRWISFLEAE